MNPGETPNEAAHRETYEELGLSTGPIQTIGFLSALPAITGTMVSPVVGFIEKDVGDLSHFTPDKMEVAKIFTRTIEELQNSKTHEVLSRNGKSMTMPVFASKDGLEDERIWGFTAYVTNLVLMKIIIPSSIDPSITPTSIDPSTLIDPS